MTITDSPRTQYKDMSDMPFLYSSGACWILDKRWFIFDKTMQFRQSGPADGTRRCATHTLQCCLLTAIVNSYGDLGTSP